MHLATYIYIYICVQFSISLINNINIKNNNTQNRYTSETRASDAITVYNIVHKKQLKKKNYLINTI